MPDFEPGTIYERDDLHDQYGGQRVGKISTPADEDFIMLFAREDDGKEEWEDDTHYVFTGEGSSGDMEMTRGNAAIHTHADEGKTLHLFTPADDGVAYRGQFEYLSHHYSPLPDKDGNKRRAIAFRLERVD